MDDIQGSYYTGNQNVSQTGNACQAWTAKGYTDGHFFGSTVVDAQNFCRQMGDLQLMCETVAGMENCEVPLCSDIPEVTTVGGSSTSKSPDIKDHGANMGPIWGRQDPGGPHVGPMNFAIWVNV